MHKGFFLFSATILAAQPAFATDQQSRAERDRQLHEIVFQNYPEHALAAGEEGPVFFTVTLDKDARPMSCQVTHGSGFPDLDAETCDLIVQHAVFSAARDANGRVTRQTTEGVVNWTLPGHTPVPINMSALATSSKPEPQVCRKATKTGTLSAVERVCMTPTEWAKQGDESKYPYEEMQGKKGFTSENMCNGGIYCDDTTLGMFNNGPHPRPQ
jgi:periplasmic protein TonB